MSSQDNAYQDLHLTIADDSQSAHVPIETDRALKDELGIKKEADVSDGQVGVGSFSPHQLGEDVSAFGGDLSCREQRVLSRKRRPESSCYEVGGAALSAPGSGPSAHLDVGAVPDELCEYRCCAFADVDAGNVRCWIRIRESINY